MKPLIKDNEVVGIVQGDILFNIDDCYSCPILHHQYHKFMKELRDEGAATGDSQKDN